MKQYSFCGNVPTLYLIATPIGNLQELTPRAIEILKNEVKIVYCENIKNTLKLFNYFNIRTKLSFLNKNNEKKRYNEILLNLHNNFSVALISDAGYPLISDPGYYVVKNIINNYNYNVVPINGSSAFLPALISSGINPIHFLFYGFLNHNKIKKEKEILKLESFPYTIIFYESSHRIINTLYLLLKIFKNRQICIAKELTKFHEQFYRGLLNDVIKEFEKDNNINLGEYVIVISGKVINKEVLDDISYKEIFEEIKNLIINNNYNLKEAIRIVSLKYSCNKNILYNKFVKLKR